MTAPLATVTSFHHKFVGMSWCPLCRVRGQPWNGDAPTCAFSHVFQLDLTKLDDGDREYYESRKITKTHPFLKENWNCATLIALRDYASALASHEVSGYQHFRDDGGIGSFATLLGSEAFDIQGILVMTWYKERGRVGSAIVMCDDDEPRAPNLDKALRFLRAAHHNATNAGCVPEGWTELLERAKILP